MEELWREYYATLDRLEGIPDTASNCQARKNARNALIDAEHALVKGLNKAIENIRIREAAK